MEATTYDVKLSIKDYSPNAYVGKRVESDFLKMKHIPKIGEVMKSSYFKNTFEVELKHQEKFIVDGIINHYNDDLSELDYIEIFLS